MEFQSDLDSDLEWDWGPESVVTQRTADLGRNGSASDVRVWSDCGRSGGDEAGKCR